MPGPQPPAPTDPGSRRGRDSPRDPHRGGPGNEAGYTDERSAGPGDGTLPRTEAVKDERIRRWDVASPSATVIGRARTPEEEIGENLRRLHEEQHPAMAGHSRRMHRLEKARITHAYCNTLDVTPWERDRALGTMVDLDLTAFGSQRAIERVALVVVQYVVDDERRRRLGLHDRPWLADQSPETMERLFDRFDSLSDDPAFELLAEAVGLDTTSVNRLDRVLREQLDEQDLHGAVLGRSPHRDPALPAIHYRTATDPDSPAGQGPRTARADGRVRRDG